MLIFFCLGNFDSFEYDKHGKRLEYDKHEKRAWGIKIFNSSCDKKILPVRTLK